VARQKGESGYLADLGVQFHLIREIDDLMEFKRWVGERRPGPLGFDTETEGLQPDFDRVRLAQFGDKQQGWAIPFERWGGAVLEILRKYEGEWVLHNSKFDIRSIQNEDPTLVWPWHRTHDTMNLAHLVNPLRAKGLKPLGGRLVDPQAVAMQKQLDQDMATHKWNWRTVPVDHPTYWIYGAMDPVLTCHIYDDLQTAATEFKDNYDLEMGTTRAVTKMEQNGMRVNPSYLEEKDSYLQERIQVMHSWLWDEFRLDNPTPLRLVKFFEDNNVPMLNKRTNSGKQAMDADVLKSIDHPVAEVVRNIRKAGKLSGTYLQNLLRLRDDNDRVHANVWTMGTRTARMTVTDPALQTLPKKDTTVRSAFIPSDGYGLISFDMDQIEARLMAIFAGSQPMIDAFNSGDDFFLMIASKVYQELITDKKDPRRQLSKGSVYGKIYGGGAETLSEKAGVTLFEMEDFLHKFDRDFPEVTMLQNKLQMLGQSRRAVDGEAWIRTPMGRRLMSDEDKDYTLTNYLIQGHAAELMKKKLVHLDTVLPSEVRLLMAIHDELVMEAPVDMIPDLMPFITDELNDFTTHPIPITWGGDYTTESWGAMVD
jgi:DNA polymerase I